MYIVRSVAFVFLIVLSSVSLAQRQKSIVPELDAEGHKGDMARAAQKKANDRFDKGDENKNGFLEKEEVVKHFPYIAENFAKYDKDDNGKLTWEEFLGHDKWKRDAGK